MNSSIKGPLNEVIQVEVKKTIVPHIRNPDGITYNKLTFAKYHATKEDNSDYINKIDLKI